MDSGGHNNESANQSTVIPSNFSVMGNLERKEQKKSVPKTLGYLGIGKNQRPNLVHNRRKTSSNYHLVLVVFSMLGACTVCLFIFLA
jgi:hypothetical protein